MKNQAIKYIVALLIIFQAALPAQNSKKTGGGQVTANFDVSKGEKLVARINPGDIVIKTWDKNQVLVKGEGVEDAGKRTFKSSKKGNVVEIEYSSEWSWSDDIKFIITVPEVFDLDVMTTGGDLEIQGDLSGSVKLTTSGGDIRTDNIKGETFIRTSGGDIELGSIKGDASVNTQGGDIELSDIEGKRVSISTMGGDIEADRINAESANIQTYGGDIDINGLKGRTSVQTYGGDLYIGANNGEIDLHTYGGDIEVERSTGDVQAKTAGGDITLLEIHGAVRAKTASGRIYAEIFPGGRGSSYLNTTNGTIILALPADAEATVRAEISLRGFKGEAFDIQSDFDLAQIKRDDRKVDGVIELNGGGQRIKLETINDNIIIKKYSKTLRNEYE